ncbi:HlyD family secretion protein [Enhydrobacter sp.]|jgi:membrane fusion protein (multidrug efflux system)|uniref:HlyD family secretion protein n=1 Tax=Enhydrobacter sp. TaxID=1894999 RepID=UPI00262C6A32|nr:HlyD family secretion protein [Enhydrobacter sp.]WIM12204.1 MAG: Membrane fusion component of MSF-type tripartite multidrug efflux system [Enhydrobacter sp.]
MSLLSYAVIAGLARSNSALLSRTALKRSALGVGLLATLGVAIDYGYDYWKVGQYQVSTDNAYVQADYTTVAPRISGYITAVLVEDNQKVKAGQVLARIDDRDFRVALDRANAEVEAAEAALRNLDAQIAQQQSVIDQTEADIASAEAALSFAKADNARYSALVKTGYGTVQRAQQAETALKEKTAQLRHDRASLLVAERKVDVLRTERGRAEASRDRSLANRHQAELNLSYTTVSAPVDGTVGARSLRVGQFVQAGTALMAVVPLHAVYVVANYKETQLSRVRPGQPANVEIDSFPGVTLEGHVDSLSPASGLEFALLPPDNATGNFTKIVQRIPVKIVLDDEKLEGLLRPGMSVEPTIDTRTAR